MRSLLLADIGNTRAKLAVSSPDGLRRAGNLVWNEADFAGRAAASVRALPRPDSTWIACVAPDSTYEELRRGLREAWPETPVRRARVQATACGMRLEYRTPESLGVDRWLGALGAWRRAGDAACVVDCGTAITVNVVAGDGAFTGGSISAGLRLMHAALATGTHALFTPGAGPHEWPARDTECSIRTGCLEAAAGIAERALQHTRRLHGTSAVGYLTGGDAPQLLPLLDGSFVHAPDIVLEGLAALAGESR